MSEDSTNKRIRLRLVKFGDREIICDQDGRPLDDVVSYDYSADVEDSRSSLSIRLRFPFPKWDEAIGISIRKSIEGR